MSVCKQCKILLTSIEVDQTVIIPLPDYVQSDDSDDNNDCNEDSDDDDDDGGKITSNGTSIH